MWLHVIHPLISHWYYIHQKQYFLQRATWHSSHILYEIQNLMCEWIMKWLCSKVLFLIVVHYTKVVMPALWNFGYVTMQVGLPRQYSGLVLVDDVYKLKWGPVFLQLEQKVILGGVSNVWRSFAAMKILHILMYCWRGHGVKKNNSNTCMISGN